MRNSFKLKALLFTTLLLVTLASPLRAASIFDNSANDLLTRFDPGTKEVGDQIILAGTERYLTFFDFEYWGANTDTPASFAGTVEARVRFYENDGAPFNGYATPGTMFFDSDWFSVPSPTARNTFSFSAGSDFPVGGLFIPVNEMTWSVQFRGMSGTDSVGVDLYSPPVAGQDYPDYWQNDGGWILLTNTVAMDFAARMDAKVPEPSAVTLSVVGGLAILGLAYRLRRNR